MEYLPIPIRIPIMGSTLGIAHDLCVCPLERLQLGELEECSLFQGRIRVHLIRVRANSDSSGPLSGSILIAVPLESESVPIPVALGPSPTKTSTSGSYAYHHHGLHSFTCKVTYWVTDGPPKSIVD